MSTSNFNAIDNMINFIFNFYKIFDHGVLSFKKCEKMLPIYYIMFMSALKHENSEFSEPRAIPEKCFDIAPKRFGSRFLRFPLFLFSIPYRFVCGLLRIFYSWFLSPLLRFCYKYNTNFNKSQHLFIFSKDSYGPIKIS
jgi:hypothetical protein